MSEFLSAAAEKMGIPEALVERSAEARAQATGASVDEILEAWAGGEASPAATTPEKEPEAETPEPETETPEPQAPEPEPEAAEPKPAAAPQPAAAAVALATRPQIPPILEGRHERPMAVLAGAVGLFVLSLLVGFAAPALPEEATGVYSSAVPLSELAQEGRQLYLSEGCAACHTQMVRPIVADAGLGGVTLSDSNQVLGHHRYGPDLAHVGSRIESDAELFELLRGASQHPSYASLGDDQLTAIVVYLIESK